MCCRKTFCTGWRQVKAAYSYSSAIKALVLVVLSKVFLEDVVNELDKHTVATVLWAWLMSSEPVRRVHFVFLR
jgi:hypothetical protein